MPHPDGTLTDDEFTAVAKKLTDLWANNPNGPPKCPTCGAYEFFIHPSLLGNRSDTVSIMSSHTRLPTVAKYCKKCGHLTEYVAKNLGITVLTVNNQ